MNYRNFFEKNCILLGFAWISNKLGILLPAIILLSILMVVDYISGMLAAKKEALENLGKPQYGWSSKKSILGIYKKIGYMLTVVAATCIDYLLFKFAHELV